MSTDNRYGNNNFPHSAGTGRTRYGNHKADTVVAPVKKDAVDGPAAAEVAEATAQAATVEETAPVDPSGAAEAVATPPPHPAKVPAAAVALVQADADFPIGWGVRRTPTSPSR